MKICMLVLNNFGTLGGVQIATLNLAEHLVQLGHEVHIVTFAPNKKPFCNLDNNLFKVHIIRPIIPIKNPYFSILGILLYIFPSFKVARKVGADIVQVQHFSPALSAYLIKKILKIPYVISVHGENNCYTERGPIVSAVLKRIRPLLPEIRNAAAIVSLTQDTKKDIEKCFKKESTVIPNGVNLKLFNLNKDRPFLDPLVPRIICISRLNEQKGIEYALYAVKLLIKDFPRTKLIIIGDGECRHSLEDQAIELKLANNVIFLGEVPNEDLANYLYDSNVFLLPSFREGFSLSLLEAMASGLPVVATPVGISPLIKIWNNGYLVPIKDSDAIYHAIREIISDPENWEIFSRNSIRYAQEYSWKKVAKKYEEQYYLVLGKYQK